MSILREKGELKFVGTVAKGGNDNSHITILPEYREALDGLNDFSHIIVLYWLHRNNNEEQRRILKVTPKRHKDAPEVGVFACRSPVRPNPIGFSVCKLLGISGRTLTVRELDA